VPLAVSGSHKGNETVNMRSRSGKQALLWSLVAAAGFAAPAAQATPIPFFDGFESFTGVSYGGGGVTSFTSGTGWQVQNAGGGGTSNVDLFLNTPGITCHTGNGCIDLDGSNNDNHFTGPMVVSDSFSLLAGHTYQLSGWVSGNQRGGTPDEVQFAFLQAPVSGVGSPIVAGTTGSLASSSPWTQYSVLYTPGSNQSVSVGFWNVSNGLISDSLGAILDDVSVTDITAVPLPASAWLLITGLLGLALVSRRGTAGGLAR
jgi:hypothetical protein